MLDLTGQVNSVDSIDASTEWNPFIQEFKNLITSMGMTMDGGDLFQLQKAVAHLGLLHRFMTCSGPANTYALSAISPRPAVLGLADGLALQFRPSAANTGASTVNVSGLGPVALVREDLTVLQANDLHGSRDALIRYDVGSSQFLLLNASLGAPAQALPAGYISGLTMGRNAGEPAGEYRDIEVQTGSCRDAANGMNMVVSTALIKRFDATLAKGTGVGGYPLTSLGARQVSTWYRFFLIGKSSNGEVDAGFDTDAAAANLLTDFNNIGGESGWDSYRQLGWVRTTGGSASELVPFFNSPHTPSVFQWASHDICPVQNQTLETTRTAKDLSSVCPPGAVAHVEVKLEDNSGGGATERFMLLTDKGQSDYTPTSSLHTLRSATRPAVDQQQFIGSAEVEVDSSSEVYVRWDSAGSFQYWLQVPRFIFLR